MKIKSKNQVLNVYVSSPIMLLNLFHSNKYQYHTYLSMLRYSIPIVHQQLDTYDVVCIGTESSNKSRLLARMLKTDKPTVPQRQKCKIVNLDHKQIKIKFTESTHNQENSLFNKYNCKNSSAIIFAYDVSAQKSFYQISNMPQLGQLKPKILIGYQTNKVREVSYEEASRFALQHELLFQQIYEWSSVLDFKTLLVKLGQEIFFTQYRKQVNDYFSKQSPKQSFTFDCPMHSSNIRTYLSIADRKLSNINRQVFELTMKCSTMQAEKIELSQKVDLLTEIKQETELQLLRMQQRYKKMHHFFSQQDITQIIQVIDMYQSESLKLKEQFLEKQLQLNQQVKAYSKRCKTLEKMCIEVDNITLDNFIAIKDHIQRQLTKYRLLYCDEASILDNESLQQYVQKENMSNILFQLQSEKSWKEQSTAYQSEIIQTE